MNQRLTPATALLLAIPPLLWAGNAVLGRLVNELVPPMTLNFFRWVLAFVILLPLAHRVLRPGNATDKAIKLIAGRAIPAGAARLFSSGSVPQLRNETSR